MNKGWLILFVNIQLLFAPALIAQNNFNKVIGVDTNSEFGSIVVKTDTGFLVTYGDVDETLITYCMGVLALDKKGNVLKKSRYCFGENKIVGYGRSLILNNGNVAHYGTLQQYDTLKKDFTTWTALTMFTPMGDTLWTRQYLDSNRHVVARSLAETKESGLWLIGDETISANNHNPLFVRIDNNGKVISSHSNIHSGITALFSVIKHPNGKYYGSGYSGASQNFDAFVVEMDTNMKPIWNKRYKSGSGIAAKLTVLEDNNMAFGTDTLIERINSTDKITRKQIFKIDTSGNVIWRKTHDQSGEGTHYRQLVATKSNHLLVLGRKEPPPPYSIYYTLSKLTPQGDTIWMHRYAYENIEDINYIWDMVATEEGGVLMVGDVTPNGSRHQDVWLVKVDSNGCLNNDCEKTLVYDMRVSVTESIGGIHNLKIFPNPSTGVFEINGLQSTCKYRYTVVNNVGQLVKQGSIAGNKLNLEQLSIGVYHLNVFGDELQFHSQKLIIND